MRTIPQTSGALHFSTRGEYGVRLMVELARHHGDGPVSLAEIADHEDLPRPYLEQLVVSLREAGLVAQHARRPRRLRARPRSRGDPHERGHRGARGPDRAHGLRQRGPRARQACGRTGFCNVNPLWVRVREAVVGALDSITLADLAGPVPGPSAPRRCPSIHSTLPVAERPAITEPIPHA